MRYFYLPLLALYLNCQTAIVNKKELSEFNQYLSGRTYTLKEDIKVDDNETYKKGMLVRVWAESTPTLFKIKIYPSQQEREYATGKMAIFIVNDDFKKEKFTLQDLENLIEQKLVFYKIKK